jgi:hypothetical protein
VAQADVKCVVLKAQRVTPELFAPFGQVTLGAACEVPRRTAVLLCNHMAYWSCNMAHAD